MNEFVLALFEGTPLGGRFGRARRGWQRFAIGLTVIVVLAAAGGEGYVFWRAWTTGVWGNFLFDTLPLLQILVLALKGMSFLPSGTKARLAREAAEKLRGAVAQGDERLAPVAGTQPEKVDEAIAGSLVVGPLRNPGSRGKWSVIGWAFMAFIVGGVVGVITLLVLLVPNNDGTTVQLASTEGALALALGVFALALIAVGTHMAVWAARVHGRIWLVADGHGLWLRGRDGAASATGMRWGEARAFYRVSLLDGKSQAVYALDGGAHLLVWSTGMLEDRDMRAAHLHVCGVLAAHTSLPLRDLTQTVALLSKPAPKAAKRRREQVDDAGAGAASMVTPEMQGLHAWGAIDWRRQIKAIAVMLLVALPLFYGLAWGAEHMQEWQFQQLAPRILAGKPIFADTLSADDGRWPMYLSNAGFINGAFQISGEYGGAAPAPGVYGDAAVQVTARLMGNASEYDGVGLILRTGLQSDFFSGIAFTVNQHGEWSISSWSHPGVDSSAVYDQQSGAIRRGDGAANTLLVLMRGHQYLCYVNGQFVGAYYDSGGVYASDTNGQVALFVDGGSGVTGTFTDFKVFPGP